MIFNLRNLSYLIHLKRPTVNLCHFFLFCHFENLLSLIVLYIKRILDYSKVFIPKTAHVTHSPLTHRRHVLKYEYIISEASTMIKIIIGSRIREFRQSSDLSQEKLALKAGIDRTYLAGVENGKRNISVVNLDKIIKALDINYEIFFKGL